MNNEIADAGRQRALSILKAHLGDKATVARLEQENDVVTIWVVSPNEFSLTAHALERAGPEVGQALGCSIEVKLSTYWPFGKAS